MTRRRKVLLWIFIPVYFFLIFPYFFLIQVPGHLALGWIPFLKSNISRMNVSISSLLSAAVLLLLLILGVQIFLGRLISKTALPRWQWRWTLSLLSLVVLTFTAGISAVGVAHQLAWLLTDPEPALKNDFFYSLVTRSNLREMGTAGNEILSVSGKLPQGGLFDEEGRALHSWETLLLPHMSANPFDKEPSPGLKIDLEKPWTDRANAAAFRTRQSVFMNPPLGPVEVDGLGASHYAWNSHLLRIPQQFKPSDVTDGLSTTLVIGEVNTGHCAWGDPVNWRDPALGLHARPDTFGGIMGEDFVGFLLLDGSARLLNRNIDPNALKALATPSGGEAIPEF